MDTWTEWVKSEMAQSYYEKIQQQVDNEYQIHTIYPEKHLILNAMRMTPLDKIKVVILGQDPYHGPQEAHGLSFSVPKGIRIPPSLRNIFKELTDDLNTPSPTHGNLTHWAEQGVFLLNTTLTVKHKDPRSHHHLGWPQFTNRIISHISQTLPYVVFILWGKDAQSKQHLIDKHHGIIQSVHPSPLSAYRGFLGSKPFSKTNQLLKEHSIEPINWAIPD